jgi:TonB family protein
MTTENNNLETYIEPIDEKMKYGAPELLKNYKKFITMGLLFTFILLAVGMTAYGLSIIIQMEQNKTKTGGLTTVELQQQQSDTKDDTPPPPDLPTEKVAALKDDAALVPEPVAKERADTTKFKTQAELDKIKTVVSSEGDINADPTKEFSGDLKSSDKEKIEKEKTKDIKETKVEKKVYQQFEVEKAPVAVNLGSVRGSMKYPEIAKANNIEGNVVVKVLVGPDGTVQSIGGISGPDVFYDEVKSKVMNLTFTPALQNGKPVSCWVSVPFKFTLQNKFKKEDKDENKEGNTEKKEGEK